MLLNIISSGDNSQAMKIIRSKTFLSVTEFRDLLEKGFYSHAM